FAENDRLAPVREPIECQDSSGWRALREELLGADSPFVAIHEQFRIGVVIVNADNVSLTAFPAVVRQHRSSGIERLCEVVKRLYPVSMCFDVGQLGHPPGLVER